MDVCVCFLSIFFDFILYSFGAGFFSKRKFRLIEYENQHSICLSLLIFVSSLPYFSFFIDNPIKDLFLLENLCAPYSHKVWNTTTRHKMFDLFMCVLTLFCFVFRLIYTFRIYTYKHYLILRKIQMQIYMALFGLKIKTKASMDK